MEIKVINREDVPSRGMRAAKRRLLVEELMKRMQKCTYNESIEVKVESKKEANELCVAIKYHLKTRNIEKTMTCLTRKNAVYIVREKKEAPQ